MLEMTTGLADLSTMLEMTTGIADLSTMLEMTVRGALIFIFGTRRSGPDAARRP